MKLILSVFFICLVLSACKKERELTPEEKAIIEVNKTKLYGKWNFVSAVKPFLIATNATPCYADNWLEFRQDGRGTISMGACIDNPPIHENQDFSWEFKDTANINFGDNEIRLVKLNDTTLTFITLYTSTGPANDEYRYKK